MQVYQDFLQLISDKQKFLLISHRKPDGDTLGAACAMKLALEQMGKSDIRMACVDPPSSRFTFIPEVKKFTQDIGDYYSYDCIIVVDCGAHYMMKYHDSHPELLSGQVPLINIDHHASNDMFGTFNIVEEHAASTTVQLYKMFRALNIKITADIATCLMAGIYNDTGSFMHSNTTKEIYDIAADLVSCGAKVTVIAKSIFKTNPISTLKAWGKAMDNATLTPDGFTMSVVTAEEIEECGATPEDLSGVVDVLNSVPNSTFTVMINEDGRGNVKGSFRTNREDVDLLKVAELFNGGGHRKAAGFTQKGKLQKKEIWTIEGEGDSTSLNEMGERSKLT